MIKMALQTIKFDGTEFYVESVTGVFPNEIKKKLPLSTWNLTKEIDVCAIVVREYSSPELEEPTKFTYYKVPLKFKVKADYPNCYLIKNVLCTEVEEWQKSCKVYLKDLENGTTVEAQTPQNKEVATALQYEVTKGKSTKLEKDDLIKVLTSGESIGVFRGLDLLERIVR